MGVDLSRLGPRYELSTLVPGITACYVHHAPALFFVVGSIEACHPPFGSIAWCIGAVKLEPSNLVIELYMMWLKRITSWNTNQGVRTTSVKLVRDVFRRMQAHAELGA